MQLHPLLTLAELAIELPAASRIFKRFRLDYCCNGQRTLADACRELGLDAGVVLAAIAAENRSAPLPLADAECDVLIDHILAQYHEPLRRELPDLIAMARKVEARHREIPGCPHGLAMHLSAMHAELLDHMQEEERVLFPLIRSRAGRATSTPIAAMRREHGGHALHLGRTRDLTADLTVPAGACTTWRALQLRLVVLESDLMDHIHIENNLLFPRALRAA